jgi:hypothetical protein
MSAYPADYVHDNSVAEAKQSLVRRDALHTVAVGAHQARILNGCHPSQARRTIAQLHKRLF